jgi:uncharacterized membrane protein YjjB (DUF3815 family)
MVYAIIYSLFLGFGITVGTVLYGVADRSATSQTTCNDQVNQYVKMLFVPPFALCLLVINQAKWKQAPVMVPIALVGYITNFFSSKVFPSNAQISSAVGAFVVGFMGNVYSRLRHGVAAAAIIPAIWVQVPSGLAASGSLLSGLVSADQIINGSKSSTQTLTSASANNVNTIVFNVGFSMIQIAVGITVGLFMSALVVYPFGKKRSGLFSF